MLIINYCRFYDLEEDGTVLVLEQNSSMIANLSCGRVKWENKYDLKSWKHHEHHWEVSDPNCILSWHIEGMTCDCKYPGTYALLKSKLIYRVSHEHLSDIINFFFLAQNKSKIYDAFEKKRSNSTGYCCISPGMGSLLNVQLTEQSHLYNDLSPACRAIPW